MPKTNGCLVAQACARFLLGHVPCVHTCDEAFQEEIKDTWFSHFLTLMVDAMPSVYKKKCSEKIKEIYFPPKEGTRNG